ncbi:hypothetical protein jhhlp_005891 [Lomentospora prolificans]|uniref:RecA family profile 1 domain-containing protein n=1 Tax=Lomentospora prolificans TaxID=41688 RepID=A0A2N3N4D3_9PEZI|nr:hypothetical protein jhhlp_005891 [Lomentospora prolificans]
MDLYHSVHGHDVSTFDIQDTHRLPAVSAAQALEDLNDDPSQCVSTGLSRLDRALSAAPESLRELQKGDDDEPSPVPSGVYRGQVTEIWGPPGVGKTAVGIQIAASALSDGHGVAWVDTKKSSDIDCTYPLCGRRFRDVAEAVRSRKRSDEKLVKGTPDEQQQEQRTAEHESSDHDAELFVHYACASLAHFIALLCRPVTKSLPSNTAVVIVDSLSALLNEAFPKTPDGRSFKSNKGSGLSTRRLQTLQYVIGALQKLAATRNCALVLLSQCATKMQSRNRGAALMPSINASVWEQGIPTRLVLFRDWMWKDGVPSDTCFVGLQRLSGKAMPNSVQRVTAFRVEGTGLVEVDYDETEQQREQLQIGDAKPQMKRKLGVTRQEVPDSDEEYGWDPDDDAHLPPEPPQWQGSEDLIIGTQRSLDGEDTEGDADADEEADQDPGEVATTAESGRH